MVFVKKTWRNGVSGGTPITAEELNRLEQGVADAQGGGGDTVTWETLQGKPSTFTPAEHGHEIVDVSGLSAALAGKQSTGDYSVDGHTHTVADVSDSTSVGRSVLTASSAANARSAIGAGTSNLALGTTSSTAKAGDYKPSLADQPAGTTLTVRWNGSAWPTRPTSRTDVTVFWVGSEVHPDGALAGDLHFKDMA